MRYVKLRYAKELSELNIPKAFHYLPKPILDFYIEKKNPYTCTPEKTLGMEGFQLILPLTVAQAANRLEQNERFIMRALSDCQAREVAVAIPPQSEIPFYASFPTANGSVLFAFYAIDAAKKLLKRQKKELANAEFLLVDGGTFLSQMVFDIVTSQVNHFSVLTERETYFEERAAEMFCDCGLNISILASAKHPLVREADIILNCSMEQWNFDYLLKRECIYFDVCKNREALKRLMGKRNDIFFVDTLELKAEESYLTAERLEAVWYLKSETFRKLLTKQYQRALLPRAMEELFKNQYEITDFRCFYRGGGKRQ